VQTIFSTTDVPQADAFDYWVDAIRTIYRHDVEAVGDRRDWYGEMKAGSLGDMTLVTWQAAPWISRCLIGNGDLLLQLPSSCTAVEFVDGGFEHGRNNLCLFDTGKPHASRSLEPIDRVAVRIPRDTLGQRIRLTEEIVNRPVPLQGDAVLLNAFVRDLVRIGPSTLSPAAAAVVREQMIDLTAVVLGNLAGIMPRLGAAARFGTLKLRVFIESQLTDPDADAQSIAAGAGVSESHANRLLALEGTSIRRLLIDRRLNKCREIIEDPRHVHRSISDIAFFYGFRNLSHFSRVFKGRFGLSPSEHRRTFDPVGH